jgi:hypothetical protein
LEVTARSSIRNAALCLLWTSLLLSAFLMPAAAQQPTGTGAQQTSAQSPDQTAPAASPAQPQASAATPAPAPKTTLADFAWLTGRWQGTWGPRVAQQAWMPPKAGVMLGTFQLVQDDKTLVLELFTLVETPDGIQLHIRHFTPSLAAWEKSGATVLNLASADPTLIVFENPIDGQPKHSIFQRKDADTYIARSEIAPDKGDMQVIEITYRRQIAGPPPKHRNEKSKPKPQPQPPPSK